MNAHYNVCQEHVNKAGSMTCFTETQLEQFAWGEPGIGGDELGHLFQCDRCRERYLVLAALHHAMLKPQLSDLTTADRVCRKAAANAPIILRPFAPSGTGNSVAHRLAAQGEQPTEHYAVTSFANVELGMIGRLLYDRQTRHLSLYLIAESGQVPQGYKVTLGEGLLAGYSDSQGCIDFGQQPESRFNKVEIASPRGIYDLTPSKPKQGSTADKKLLKLSQHPLSEIELRIDREGPGNRYLVTCRRPDAARNTAELEVVGFTDRRILAAKTSDGVAVLETEAGEIMHKIHIY